MRRTLGQRLVVPWLGLMGVSAFLYAGLLPLPPVSEQPVPQVWWGFGAVALTATVGVLRRAAWARLLAAAIAALSALWTAWTLVSWMLEVGLSAWIAQGRWLDILLAVLPALLALWWLVRRWPAPVDTHR